MLLYLVSECRFYDIEKLCKLAGGKSSEGGQRKRFKDTLKIALKA